MPIGPLRIVRSRDARRLSWRSATLLAPEDSPSRLASFQGRPKVADLAAFHTQERHEAELDEVGRRVRETVGRKQEVISELRAELKAQRRNMASLQKALSS